MSPRATPGDVEWIDGNGYARVCGYAVYKTEILAFEEPGDRRADGHLTAAAKERIAAELSHRLRERDAAALAEFHNHGRPVTWRTCDG